MQILTANHWIEISNQYGRVRGRTERVEGDYNPIRRKTMSINSDPSELPKTKPREPRSIHGLVHGPRNRCMSALPYMASV